MTDLTPLLAAAQGMHIPWKYISLIGLFFVCTIVFHYLEKRGPRVIPEHPPGPLHRGWLADFTGALVDGPVLAALVEIVAIFIVLQVPPLLGKPLRDWPWLAAFALYFVVNDFGRYWLHRWYHQSDFLWRFHRVHHSATHMSVWTNFRMHVLEAVPKYALLVLPFKLFGISGWVLVVYSAIDLVKGFWHHANLKTHIGNANLVLNSAEQHWWHHSTEARGQLSNFGSVLSIWDRMFGTFYWPRGEWPKRIGVEGLDAFPDDYVGRFVSGFQSDEQVLASARADQSTSADSSGPNTTTSPAEMPRADSSPARVSST